MSAKNTSVAGVEISLRIGQRVRHQDYAGKRVTGVVMGLSVDHEHGLMVDCALDEPIVIPAGHGFNETKIYRQHAQAHEFSPFDDRDELIEALQSALQDLAAYHDDVPKAADQRLLDAAYAAIAKATGSAL